MHTWRLLEAVGFKSLNFRLDLTRLALQSSEVAVDQQEPMVLQH